MIPRLYPVLVLGQAEGVVADSGFEDEQDGNTRTRSRTGSKKVSILSSVRAGSSSSRRQDDVGDNSVSIVEETQRSSNLSGMIEGNHARVMKSSSSSAVVKPLLLRVG